MWRSYGSTYRSALIVGGKLMDKKMRVIMILSSTIALIGIIIGTIARLAGDSSGIRETLYPVIFICTLLSLIVTMISSSNPANPVHNIIFVLSNKKYSMEKKKRNLDYYVTKELKSREKYNILTAENFTESKRILIKERGKENSTILVELSNGQKYEFTVEKRNKENTVKAAGKWVVKDYRKLK